MKPTVTTIAAPQAPRPFTRPRRRSRRRGGALVLVLVVAAALVALAVLTTTLSTRTSAVLVQDSQGVREFNELESALELFRIELVSDYTTSARPATAWVSGVTLDKARIYAAFPNVSVWVSARSTPTGAQWLELTASHTKNYGARQSAKQLINFDASSVFDLAILCETTDCMMCHLKVRGDVGTIFDKFRPGHDADYSGQGTSVDGTLYAAGTVVRAEGETNAKAVNGAVFSQGVQESSTSSKLPIEDGKVKLPRLDPARIVNGILADQKNGAGGSIGGGSTASNLAEIYALPPEQTFQGRYQPADVSRLVGVTADPAVYDNKTSGRVGVLPPVWDGNLVLIGTRDRPIKLDGEVFVTGDVVIQGVVEGKGAIYAGRNVYVAGDVTYKNQATNMLKTLRSGAGDADASARLDIAAGADELRLAARANIVLGDYVETAGKKELPIKDRQASDYFRLQFDLPRGTTRYFTQFQPASGDARSSPSIEVKLVNGQYRPFDWRAEDGGDPIDPKDVVSQEGYETLRPVRLTGPGNGNVREWLTDDQYRGILGTQELSLNTVRATIPTTTLSTTLPSSTAQIEARAKLLAEQLGIPRDKLDNGSYDLAQWIDQTGKSAADLTKGLRFSFDPADTTGASWTTDEYKNPLVTVYKKGIFDANGNITGYTLRLLDERVQTYPKQSETVDAFLYSNQRIAGLTMSGTNLDVNGGMISSEIGVLAPGRRAVTDASMDAWEAGDKAKYGTLRTEGGTFTNDEAKHYAWRQQTAHFSSTTPADTWKTTGKTTTLVGTGVPTDDVSRFKIQKQVTTTGSTQWVVSVTGGTTSVTVSTGYGQETFNTWNPNATASYTFTTEKDALARIATERAKTFTVRIPPTVDGADVTRSRTALGGSAGQGSKWNTYVPGGTTWQDVTNTRTGTAYFYKENADTAGNDVTTGGITTTLNGLVAQLNAGTITDIRFASATKYKTDGMQDTLDSLVATKAGGPTERDAFLNRYQTAWNYGKTNSLVLNNGVKTDLQAQGLTTNAANGEVFGKMVVNYDYRLRNGGLGFDLVGSQVGRRLVWIPTGYVAPPK